MLDPKAGNYDVVVQGTGAGEYSLTVLTMYKERARTILREENVTTELGKVDSYVVEVKKTQKLKRPTNWPLIGGIIAVLAVISTVAILYKRRR